ncbi:MAG: exosortase/archaeosortase family protein [Chthoniobacterales bacterium]
MIISRALVPGALWLWLFWRLHDEWTLNAQYNYGWGVPLLAAFLFVMRWPDRPEPRPSSRDRGSAWLGAGLLALIFPIHLIEQANPDWRLLNWILAFAVVAYSLLALGEIGGRGWIKHFAFPVCFPLVAVPWLVQIENFVVQNLTHAVAFAAVEIVGWLGVGAYQLGNVIELRDGFVGVNEACSGVRTLQASIMVTLVLGELFFLPLGRRVGLFLFGCAWVFFCNILRATVLVLIAATRGTKELEHWHDAIGTIGLVVGMAGLVIAGWLLRTRNPETAAAPRSVTASSPPPIWTRTIAALVWLIFICGATELWYRAHEKNLLALPRWQVAQPNESLAAPIADETRSILHYSEASSATWQNPPGILWWSFFARWAPERAALQLVRSHSPEICLPATGRTFVRELPPVVVQTKTLPLRFRAYQFEQQEHQLFVFVCVQEDKIARAAGAASAGEWNAGSRLLAAWRGERNLGQRLLEIAVIGFENFQPARAAFDETVRAMVAPDSSTG